MNFDIVILIGILLTPLVFIGLVIHSFYCLINIEDNVITSTENSTLLKYTLINKEIISPDNFSIGFLLFGISPMTAPLFLGVFKSEKKSYFLHFANENEKIKLNVPKDLYDQLDINTYHQIKETSITSFHKIPWFKIPWLLNLIAGTHRIKSNYTDSNVKYQYIGNYL